MMTAVTRLAAAVLVLHVCVLIAGAPSNAAQQPPASAENCNQPMTRPITDVATPGVARRPTPTRDGCWLFAGFVERKDIPGGSGIALMRRKGDTFEEVRTVPLLLRLGATGGVPSGLVLTPDDKVLIVSHGQRVTFLDVEKFKTSGDPVLGYLEGPRISGSWGVTITPDGNYAFAAQQTTASVAMIDVARARGSRFENTALTGIVPTSPQPISLRVSPDGKYLYVANRDAPEVIDVPQTCLNGTGFEGVVQIVDIERAKTDSSSATVRFAAPAGCGPQNVAISPDNTRLSVTAGGRLASPILEDNAIVLFDTRPLREGKSPVPAGRIPMPASPVQIEDTGERIIVGFLYQQAIVTDAMNVMVIDPSKAASGKGAIVGTFPFPALYLKLTDDRRTLFASRHGTLSIIDLERAPWSAPAPKE